VDDKQAHAALADNCIRLMSTLLRQDICRLGTPGTLIADVQKNHLENYFPLELKYACSHWVQHLEQRQHYINDGDSTDTFLQKHFLHWLEAMSLMGETKKCTYMIDKLRGLAKVGVIHYSLYFFTNLQYRDRTVRYHVSSKTAVGFYFDFDKYLKMRLYKYTRRASSLPQRRVLYGKCSQTKCWGEFRCCQRGKLTGVLIPA
jgi:hypothetical protein